MSILFVLASLTVFAENIFQPKINKGIWGSVRLLEGDCMPSTDKFRCQDKVVSRRIYILEPAKNKDMDINYLHKEAVIVKEVASDLHGFYQVELPPGVYSVFVDDDGKKYCNSFGGQLDQVCQVVVKNSPVEFNIQIDHAVW